MKYCIESLLPGGEQVELLIVNDGSSDQSGAIADAYARKYPTIVRAIHQVNGGHGEAVNAGIRHATGLYFKVVDSDDWVDIRAYLKLLAVIEDMVHGGHMVDLLISNFVYEKEGANYKKTMKYTNVLPENKVFTWDEVSHFRKGQYFMIHSLMYRTQVLRDSRLELPKHTFYVDNLFVVIPLQYVKTLYYVNVDLYRYFIGREGQSVQEKTMIKRVDQQIKVNKLMFELLDIDRIHHPHLREYLLKHLEIVTVISTFLLIRSGTAENLVKKKELWAYIEERDVELYRELKYGFLGRLISLPGWAGRNISVGAYKISQKLVGFN